MSYSLLLITGALLLVGVPAVRAASLRPTPVDTVLGHTQLVRHMEASLCSQLSSRPAAEVRQLTEPELQKYMQQLITKSLLSDSVALMSMMQRAQQQGLLPQQVGESLGYDALIALSKSCPASLPLIARLGMTAEGQKRIAESQPKLEEADRAVLQPIASGICASLSAANAKKPFASLTPAQREAQFTLFFAQQVKDKRALLLRRYTAAQLADEVQMRSIGGKVAQLLLAQQPCNQLVMLLGVDALNAPEGTKP